MKRNKIALISVTFILGAVFGISLIAMLSFVNFSDPPSPNGDISTITPTEANHYFHNYYDHADSSPGKIKGFTIDRLQLEVMNNLVGNDRSLVGFRVYMGKSDAGEKISIVVGLPDISTDGTIGRIYRTESRNSDPCPTLCDINSPITKD